MINPFKRVQVITIKPNHEVWSDLYYKYLTKICDCKFSKSTIDLLIVLKPILCIGELVKPYIRFKINKLIEIDQST